MRPVNLIPPEERRGQRSANRTGPLVYVVVGVLGAILIALALVVTTSNSISDRKAEREELESQKATLQAQSDALRNYAQFAGLAQLREGTIISLAHSRFDWERVMRELSLVLPSDVWLTQVTATVSPQVTLADSGGVPLRANIPGPALELIGCGSDQRAVARFIAALHEIDGVTRVGVNKSERASETADTSSTTVTSGAGGAPDGSDCRTRDSIPQFQIVAAFDNAPLAPSAEAGATPPAPSAPPASTAQPTGDSGTADAQQQQAAASQATTNATQQAQQAAQIVPGR